MIYTNRVFEVYIPGDPIGQPRARATSRGKHAHVYNPTTTSTGKQHPIVFWKFLLASAINPLVPREPLAGPVSIHLSFYFKRPAKLMTKKAREDEFPYVIKPDADNLAKAVKDVMTQCGVYKDDSQVWHMGVTKKYTEKDSRRGAGVHISVYDDSKEMQQ